MRTLLYVPVAYVAGIEGFGLFLPYILFIAATMILARQLKNSRRRAIANQTFPTAGLLELEPAAA